MVHAVEALQREIRAADPNGRRKYLRDFTEAFQTYERVLAEPELRALLDAADVLLVGDYHALPASQQYAATLLREAAATGRPVVLAVETVFSRDQRILDEWLAGEIDDDELRDRIRYDRDWGYAWEPFLDLLRAGRLLGQGVYGLDCMPRGDLRKIAARDRHAATKILEVRRKHPEARIMALFGESHLAPNHLPLHVNAALPTERVLTVLQNVDTLYWRAAGERRDRVDAVKVSDDVVCVFNSSPLEKYESYRLCIERWRHERPCAPDLAPTVYTLINALARFLNIDEYSAGGAQPQYLVDLVPEVCVRGSDESIRRHLERKRLPAAERARVMDRLAGSGVAYVARLNTVFILRLEMGELAEEVSRFVHHACRGCEPPPQEFYAEVLVEALAYFGSRVLSPARSALREADLYALYAHPREAIEERTLYSYREYMRMIDFLVLHKDLETYYRQYHHVPDLLREGLEYTGDKREFIIRWLGRILGSELYDAYLAGEVSKRWIRALFLRKLNGRAREHYFEIARRIRRRARRPLAA
jgi:hypothetical protein